jgi:multisubunit Na+/H+ antiporter MnhF subunit
MPFIILLLGFMGSTAYNKYSTRKKEGAETIE